MSKLCIQIRDQDLTLRVTGKQNTYPYLLLAFSFWVTCLGIMVASCLGQALSKGIGADSKPYERRMKEANQISTENGFRQRLREADKQSM